MKKLIFVAFTLMFASFSAAAVSLPGQNFNVAITLTSKCEVVTPPSDISLSYTSFQATTSAGTTVMVFRCTNNLPISSITLDPGAAGTITDAVTALQYNVVLSGIPASGNGANQTVTATATILANQAGTCAVASCTNAASANRTRTITVNY